MQPQEEPNPLMRKKKTPEELAAEAEAEDLDDFTSEYSNLVRIFACEFLVLSLNSYTIEKIALNPSIN